MATKPIYAFYVDRFTSAEWTDETGWNTARFQTVQDTFSLALSDAGINDPDTFISTYRYGVNAKLDKAFDLQALGTAKVPQILFATPDPSKSDGSAFFLAKLVQNQINRKNIALMLKTVRSLDYKTDPSGKVSFYDPSFHLFGNASIGFNPTSAAGGSLIGLGLDENPNLNRTGQVLGDILDFFKKALPLLVLGAIVYESQKK